MQILKRTLRYNPLLSLACSTGPAAKPAVTSTFSTTHWQYIT